MYIRSLAAMTQIRNRGQHLCCKSNEALVSQPEKVTFTFTVHILCEMANSGRDGMPRFDVENLNEAHRHYMEKMEGFQSDRAMKFRMVRMRNRVAGAAVAFFVLGVCILE